MAQTINEIVYNHFKQDDEVLEKLNGFYYIVNDKEALPPFASLFTVDDPKEVGGFCDLDGGQTRFQIDIFSNSVSDGVDLRQFMQDKSMELLNTDDLDFNIFNIIQTNITDREKTIQELFDFSFQIIVYWYKD